MIHQKIKGIKFIFPTIVVLYSFLFFCKFALPFGPDNSSVSIEIDQIDLNDTTSILLRIILHLPYHIDSVAILIDSSTADIKIPIEKYANVSHIKDTIYNTIPGNITRYWNKKIFISGFVESKWHVYDSIEIDIQGRSPDIFEQTYSETSREHEQFKLYVKAKGTDTVTFSWHKLINNKIDSSIISDSLFSHLSSFSDSGWYESTLFFQSISLSDSGWYVCIAQNQFGQDTSGFIHLNTTPNLKPVFIVGPGTDTMIEDQSLTFPIRVKDPEHDIVALKFLNYDSLRIKYDFKINNLSLYTFNDSGLIKDSVTQQNCSLFIPLDSGSIYFSPGLRPGRYVFQLEIRDLYGPFIDSIVVNVLDSNFCPECLFDTTITLIENETSTLNLSNYCTDRDMDTLSYTLREGLPENDSVNPITGIYTFTPSFLDSGHYTIVVDVKDGSVQDSIQFKYNVKNKNRSPFFIPDTFQSYIISEDSVLTIPITVFDPDSDACLIIIDTAKTTLPGKDTLQVIDSSLSWKAGYEDYGSYNLFLKVSDGIDYDSIEIIVKVENVNRPCNIQLKSSNGKIYPGYGFDTLTEMTTMVCSLRVTDPDPEDTPVILKPRNLPPEAVFDTTTGVFRYQPDFAVASLNNTTHFDTIIFLATDSLSNHQLIVACTLSIVVSDSNTTAVDTNINLSINESSTVAINLKVSDADGDALSWALMSPLAWGSLDVQNGHITNSSECIYTAKNLMETQIEKLDFLIRDAIHTCTTTVSITINAKNEPPVFDSISKIRVNEDNTEGVVFNIYAHDPEGNSISWNLQTAPHKGVTDTGGIISNEYSEGKFKPYHDSCASDSFFFTISDNVNKINPIPALIMIDSVNDRPVFTGTPSTEKIMEDNTILITKERYFNIISDVDNSKNDLRLLLESGNNYTIVNDNEVKPDLNFSNDSLHVSIMFFDGKDTSERVIQKIWVEPINDVPVITGQNMQKPLEGFDTKDVVITLENLICSDIDNPLADLSLILVEDTDNRYTVMSDSVIRPNKGSIGDLMANVKVHDGRDTSVLFTSLVINVKEYVNTPPKIEIERNADMYINYEYPMQKKVYFSDPEGIDFFTILVKDDINVNVIDSSGPIYPDSDTGSYTFEWYLPLDSNTFNNQHSLTARIVDSDNEEDTTTVFFRVSTSYTSDSLTICVILDTNGLFGPNVTIIENTIKNEYGRIAIFYGEELGLKQIPYQLGFLDNLEELYLNNNAIKEIPNTIGSLSRLVYLDLSENVIESLPNEFHSFEALEELSLSNNLITSLPPSFSSLSNLIYINCRNNKFTTFPDVICKLNGLMYVDLDNNKIDAIPDEIASLVSLEELSLGNNVVTVVPKYIGQLISLQKLNLNNNKLKFLPPDITGNLTSLKTLNLTNNQLDSLPAYIGTFTSLKYLSLDTNNLKGLPGTIVNLKNININNDGLNLSQNELTVQDSSVLWWNWANKFDPDWHSTQK